MIEAVDNWAARNKTASRSEALRALIERGLKRKRGGD
jgi:metal-responsive CopG/Arc/MetJ family transcriptional regulator